MKDQHEALKDTGLGAALRRSKGMRLRSRRAREKQRRNRDGRALVWYRRVSLRVMFL